MPFDLATAKPVEVAAPIKAKFDLATAKPVESAAVPEEKKSYGQQLLQNGKDILTGLGEPALQMASGFAGQVAGGVAGLGNAATNLVGLTDNDPKQTVEKVANAMTYEPRTESGQNVAKIPAYVGEKLEQGSDFLGRNAAEITGSPAIGAAVKTLPTAAAMMLDPAIRGTVIRGNAGVAVRTPMPVERPPTAHMTDQQVHAAAVETLRANDIPVYAHQETTQTVGSNIRKGLKRAGDTILGDSAETATQNQAFTRAALQRAGIQAERATPDAMATLNDHVSNTYNQLVAANPTVVDLQLVNDLRQARHQILREVPHSEQGPLLTQIDDVIRGFRPSRPTSIDGRLAQNNRASLVRMESSANKSVAYHAGELKEILDDAFERSATPDARQGMRDVRVQFGRMKDIEAAVAHSTDGTITPAKLLAAVTTKKARGRAVYGRGDQSLVDLAKAGTKVIPDKTPNSGTPMRSADAAKVAMLGAAHVGTLGADMALAGVARAVARGRPGRHTAAGVAARNAAGPPIAPIRRGTLAAVLDKETPEQKKRRLMAEALKAK